MVVYSIKDLENLTGVKAHTLRIWEQRYGIVKPKRTETNIRYYLEEDLELILRIALLNRNGIKISKIACLSKEEIIEKALEHTTITPQMADNLDGLTLSVMNLDEYKFNHLLETYIHQIGFENTFEQVLFPLLEKISHMWMSGCMNKVQEHFVTSMIIRKTVAQIDRCSSESDKSGPLTLLFLPKGENQELSMHFMHYLLKNKGNRVMNLGKDVDPELLKQTAQTTGAKYIFTIINELYAGGQLQNYVDKLCSNLKGTIVLISGYQTMVQKLKLPKNCRIMPGLKEIKQFFESEALSQ